MKPILTFNLIETKILVSLLLISFQFFALTCTSKYSYGLYANSPRIITSHKKYIHRLNINQTRHEKRNYRIIGPLKKMQDQFESDLSLLSFVEWKGSSYSWLMRVSLFSVNIIFRLILHK